MLVNFEENDMIQNTIKNKTKQNKSRPFLTKHWLHGSHFCSWNNCIMLTINFKTTIFQCSKNYSSIKNWNSCLKNVTIYLNACCDLSLEIYFSKQQDEKWHDLFYGSALWEMVSIMFLYLLLVYSVHSLRQLLLFATDLMALQNIWIAVGLTKGRQAACAKGTTQIGYLAYFIKKHQ